MSVHNVHFRYKDEPMLLIADAEANDDAEKPACNKRRKNADDDDTDFVADDDEPIRRPSKYTHAHMHARTDTHALTHTN